MKIPLKHKLGTIIAINKQQVLSYFDAFIESKTNDSEKESYECKDGSLLILRPGYNEDTVFVQFHLNLQIDKENKSIRFEGKNWFMFFCQEHDSPIQNLRTKVVMPASDGAIMDDLFHSETFRLAKHAAHHPKDLKDDQATS